MNLGYHPVNLGFRLVLELSAIVGIAVGASRLADPPLSWALAVLLPVAAAVVWGRYNVPGDESRSGRAPVRVRGRVRLTIELLFFAAAALLLAGPAPVLAVVLGVAVVVHYGLSVDRIRWLLAN